MPIPHSPETLHSTFGYHPLDADVLDFVRAAKVHTLLVVGPDVPDIHDSVGDLRFMVEASVELPIGLYWFAQSGGVNVLLVSEGTSPVDGLITHLDSLHAAQDLVAASQWQEVLWEQAASVPRATFAVGDDVLVVTSGQDSTVKARRFTLGVWLYDLRLDGRRQSLPEDQLSPLPDDDDPASWVAGGAQDLQRFASTLTRAKLQSSLSDTVFSFRATRTLFRPYQFKPVIKLLQTGKSRLLIADEVGLGKTIEAGLIWTELEARRNADRVLVISPSNLVAKWRREMEERFSFILQELDGPGLADFAERALDGRLSRRAAYISSLERLRTWRELEELGAVIPQFDLVIVDEAHYLRNVGTKSNTLGALISELTDNMVFLSATPLNLHSSDLFNLLDLLSPGEFGDPTGLEEQLQPNAVLHRIAHSLNQSSVTSQERLTMLDELERLPFGIPLLDRPELDMLREILAQPELEPGDIVNARRNLADLNALSAVLTRTRKVEVDEDKALREPQLAEVVWTEPEAEFYSEYYRWCQERAEKSGTHIRFSQQMPLRLASACLPAARDKVLSWGADESDPVDEDNSSPASVASTVPPHPELITAAKALGDRDTKLDTLLPIVDQLVSEKRQMLLFTFSRPTLTYLEKHLQSRARVAVLHGGVGHDKRRRIMTDFREGKYDIVLANRVASEGLDFEFCSVVINYDLPWNPMEVEQRIGRIDRIGQKEEKILVINFYNQATIDESIMLKILYRIGLFEKSIGALEPIITSHLSEITGTILDFSLTERQREAKTNSVLQAIEAQAAGLEDLASASSILLAADDVDVRGMEDDLLRTGRYIGPGELVHLLQDWCATAQASGITIAPDGRTMSLRGNPRMAEHLRGVVARGERTTAEVEELITLLQSEIEIVLILDQELARTAGGTLLTSTHPLILGALSVPGFEHTRYACAAITATDNNVPSGTYVVQLGIAQWGGVRPGREIWAEAVTPDGSPAPAAVSEALMAHLAAGTLMPSRGILSPQEELSLVDRTSQLLSRRQVNEAALKDQEAASLLASRRVSLNSQHQRKLRSLDDRIATSKQRNGGQGVRLFEAQKRRAAERLELMLAKLATQTQAGLRLEPLAVCQLEVSHG